MMCFRTCHLRAGQHLPQNPGKEQNDLVQVTQHPNFISLLKALALLISKQRSRSPREGICRAHLVEKLYKTGPSPCQVPADLKGKAGASPARLGRGAGKSNMRVQCCRMPALTFSRRLLGLCMGSELLCLSQSPWAGGDKQELGAPGADILPAPAAEE